MRVLQVMESTIGGTRRHIADLSMGLLKRGVETHLVVSAEREPAFRKDLALLEQAGARVSMLPMRREISPRQDFGHYRELKRILKAVRPQIVHTHSSKAGVLGRAASLSTAIGARVHTPHTFAFLFSAMFSAVKRGLYRRIESYLGARTGIMIAVSESEAETIRTSGVIDPDRIRVVPNGIDPAPWMSETQLGRAELQLPETGPLAIVAGLLNRAKGQDLAIRALNEPGLEEVQLALAGHGEWRAELEALAHSLGLADRVHFLGWRNDMNALFGATDVVLVPSRWEGMPYVVLEAGARGVPVVGTRVDGVRELVEEGRTGFLADVESAPDLARALGACLALTPERRRELGAAARARVLADYGVEGMVDGMLRAYEELL